MSRNTKAEIKKSVSVLLALVMVFGSYLLPVGSVWAEGNAEGIPFSSSNDDGILTGGDVNMILQKVGLNSESTFYAILNENIKSIGNDAFYGCTGLIGVTIPDGVTSIGVSAFSGCIGLTDVSIPNSVTDIGAMAFSDCTNLTSVIIPPSVNSINDATFFNCTNLADVTIPDSVTNISILAFSGCTGLTNVIIPENVTSIGAMAFSECTGLTSIDIPANVKSIGNAAFSKCTGLISINVDENNSNYSSDNDGLVFNKDKTVLIICPAGKTGVYSIPDGIERIENRAFFGCENLTGVTIPNSVLHIGVAAFGFCSKLTGINIGNGVKDIGDSAFGSCISLTSIIIPNSVVSIGYGAFHSCFGLTNIIVPDSVTSIGDYAFYLCTSLTDVVLGKNVGNIGYSAFFETLIKTISLPRSLQTFGFYSGVNEDEGVFSHMGALENIVFEDGTTIIPDNAFAGMSSVDTLRKVKVYLPKSVEKISINCGLDQNTTVAAFALSRAEKYAETNQIPHITIPTISVGAIEAPPAYQYIPYSIKFESSKNSWLITKSSINWPDGLKIAIDTDEENKRVRGEIYGAPITPGSFSLTVEATDGNSYLLKDEITFEIDVERYLEQEELEVIINKNRRVHTPLGVYSREKATYIVDVYTKDPVDKEIIFDCDFNDFIGLWIDGMPMVRDFDSQAKYDKQAREGDYYAENGSTRITVYGETFSKLARLDPDPDKDHVIAAEFKVGGMPDGEHYTVAQNFRINVIDEQELPKTVIPGPSGGTGSIPPPKGSTGEEENSPEPPPQIPDLPFLDIKGTDWFAQDIVWVYQLGIMIGVSDSEFAPYAAINTAMITTALSRMLKVDLDVYSAVEDGKWYSKALTWGEDIGLFDEIGELNFDTLLDRWQVSIFLARLLRGAGVDEVANEDAFIFFDVDMVSAEALDALKLLNTKGIMVGKGNGMMDPEGVTTRAELAAILHRVDEYITELTGRYGAHE